MEVGYGLDKLKNYFEGRCSISEEKPTESFINTAEQKFNPNFNKDEFNNNLADVMHALRS